MGGGLFSGPDIVRVGFGVFDNFKKRDFLGSELRGDGELREDEDLKHDPEGRLHFVGGLDLSYGSSL